MGKSSPKPPPAPDPVATANAQAAANEKTARVQTTLNRVNEYTPWGSVIYTDLGNDRWRRDVQLSPDQQRSVEQEALLDRQLNQLGLDSVGRVQDVMSKPFTLADIPRAPGIDDFGAERQRVEDALYGRATSRLDPQFETQQRRLETQLTNQGIARGSEAWNREMDSFGRQRTDAYDAARSSAISAGGSEQSRLYGLGQNARERAIQEAAFLRSQPLNEITALMSGGQVTAPQFSPTPQTGVNPTDVLGATNMAYQGQLNNYNQQMGQRNALMGGLFGLGGAALGGWAGSPAGSAAIAGLFSDRRVKEDIRRVGTTDGGLPVYTFRYVGQPTVHMGVMAQEVERVMPEAVGEVGGVKTVDYGMIR